MKLIRTLCLAFSMYSRIPMPILEYTQEDMRYTFLAFPLVGVVIAALEYGWFLICGRTGIGTSLYAALAAAIPPFENKKTTGKILETFLCIF